MEYQEWSTQHSVITYMEKDTKIKNIFCFLSLFFYCYTHYVYVIAFLVVPQLLIIWFCWFLSSPFSFLLRLEGFS